MKRITISLCLSISVWMMIWTQSACSLAGTLTPERAAAAIKASGVVTKTQKSIFVPSKVTLTPGKDGGKTQYSDIDYANEIPVVMVFKNLGVLTFQDFTQRQTYQTKAEGHITTTDRWGSVSGSSTPAEYRYTVSHVILVSLTADKEKDVLTRDWSIVEHRPIESMPNIYLKLQEMSSSDAHWQVQIAEVAIDKITDIMTENFTDGDAKVTFNWHWKPTISGKSFDENDSWFKTLPVFLRNSLSGSSLFDSSEIHAGMAIMNREGTKWTVQEVNLNPKSK